jgi:hypothetical protein
VSVLTRQGFWHNAKQGDHERPCPKVRVSGQEESPHYQGRFNMLQIPNIKKARCFLVYAIAPKHLTAPEANARINEYTADDSRGLALFHDHFIGQFGGVIVLFVDSEAQRVALQDVGPLNGWDVKIHPLIFANSPAAFDEQIAYTLRAYHGKNWDELQQEQRPHFGNVQLEVSTGMESEE